MIKYRQFGGRQLDEENAERRPMRPSLCTVWVSGTYLVLSVAVSSTVVSTDSLNSTLYLTCGGVGADPLCDDPFHI